MTILEYINYIKDVIFLLLSISWIQAILMASIGFLIAKKIKKQLPDWLNNGLAYSRLGVAKPLINIIIPVIYYFILISGLIFSVYLLPLESALEFNLIATLKTIILVIFTIALLKVAKFTLKTMAEMPHRFDLIQMATVPLFDKINLILILILSVYFACAIWHIDMTAVLASAGIAGLAIGMAAKDSLSDVISGILILTDAPYKVGDVITLDNGDKGTITYIGIRSSQILTADKVEITLSNTTLIGGQVHNESSGKKENYRRFRVDVNIAYGSEIEEIRKILLELAKQHPDVEPKPAPTVALCGLKQHHIALQLRVWVNTKTLPDPTEDLNEIIYTHFQQKNIQLHHANNQLDVTIKDLPALQAYIKEIPELYEKINIESIPDLNHKTSMSIDKMPDILGKPVARTKYKNDSVAVLHTLKKNKRGDYGKRQIRKNTKNINENLQGQE